MKYSKVAAQLYSYSIGSDLASSIYNSYSAQVSEVASYSY